MENCDSCKFGIEHSRDNKPKFMEELVQANIELEKYKKKKFFYSVFQESLLEWKRDSIKTEIDYIENWVTCHRDPETTMKKKDSFCSGWKQK